MPRPLHCPSPSRGRPVRTKPLAGPVLVILALLGGPLSLAPTLRGADVAWRDGFEAPEPSWVLLGPAETSLLRQQRRQLSENGSPLHYESLTTTAPAGYSAHVAQAIPKAPLIDEFRATVRIRSPQVGLQIGVEVVCPRTAAGGESEPARLLVVGSRYGHPDTWQTLVADDLPRAAKRQARFQKTAAGAAFDLQEAYVDRVVLILPGGPNPTVVDIDEVAIHGVIFAPSDDVRHASHTVDPVEAPILEGPLLESVLAKPAAPEVRQVDVARRGETIAVSGAPLLPRIVRHHGEAMTTLAELGFNTVWLDHPPTPEELAEAYRARLWVIAPPPDAEALKTLSPNSPWQAVLAWSLGQERTAIDVDATRSLAEGTRLADQHLRRPLVVGTLDRRRTYGQLADILIEPLPQWSGFAPHSAPVRLLGCVRWVAVEAQQSPLAKAQSLAFAPHQPELAWNPPLMIRQLVVESVTEGARGVLVETGDSLASQQAPVRRLASQLELLHRELSLLEPWLVGGKGVGGASIDRREEVVPRSWQLERARLIMVPPHAPVSPPASLIETLTVAGIPETASAHLVTTAGLVSLEVHRVTGGLRVVVGDMSGGAMILLTDDQRAIAQLNEHTSQHAERSAKGERDLAMAELMALDAALEETLGRGREQGDPLGGSKGMLQQCDLLLASRDYPRALQLARTLRYGVHRQSQLSLVSGKSTIIRHESWPIRPRPAAWGSASALSKAAESLGRGPNILPAGDFEQLDQVRGAGWTHLHYDSQAWRTSVELVSDSPRHGAAALRLKAAAVPGQVSDVGPWQPLVWINSPELLLAPGTTIEITGWARLEAAAARLVVGDSLGGEELALRIEGTEGWEQFRAIRSVGPSGKLSLRLALVGAGQAEVDAVMVRQILPPSRPAPATAGAPSARPR